MRCFGCWRGALAAVGGDVVPNPKSQRRAFGATRGAVSHASVGRDDSRRCAFRAALPGGFFVRCSTTSVALFPRSLGSVPAASFSPLRKRPDTFFFPSLPKKSSAG